MAASRPAPGPRTKTSICLSPCSIALRAASSAAVCAANGVDLREPLKPALPALDHDTTLPVLSVSVTIVLLNVAWMWATPVRTSRRSLRLPPFLRGAGLPRRSAVLSRLPRASSSGGGGGVRSAGARAGGGSPPPDRCPPPRPPPASPPAPPPPPLSPWLSPLALPLLVPRVLADDPRD